MCCEGKLDPISLFDCWYHCDEVKSFQIDYMGKLMDIIDVLETGIKCRMEDGGVIFIDCEDLIGQQIIVKD